MTSISIGLIIYKRHQIDHGHLLGGFQAHGTNASDEYRKFIALIRETQIAHLYPNSINSEKIFSATPYPSFNPQINPCTKRFYLSTCPILPYTELTFEFKQNTSNLFDNLHNFQSICKLEWSLRARYTNCSRNQSCCHLIGPVTLLFHDKFTSSDQCDNLTQDEFHDYSEQWSTCSSSSWCSNSKLKTYLTYLKSPITFKVYISIENNLSNLVHLYEHIHNYHLRDILYLKYFHFDSNHEDLLFSYYLQTNEMLLYLTIILYLLCLFFFVKNLFFILIITLHIFLTILSCYLIYFHLLHFPITILNYTSITLYLFLLIIDSFLWSTCWFLNNHRRDDCTIERIIDNLLTQTFLYIIPKNLTAIIALVITFTNQVIAMQCFIVFSFLLILISFLISFTLYPASFIFILRYKSSIPTIEHLPHNLLTSTTNCLIDHTIPWLIVRLKGFWLALLTCISCLAFIIVFYRPKLQFDACHLTFDALPMHSSTKFDDHALKHVDIDVTYYIGSPWDLPAESLIPFKDIPILSYTPEDSLTATEDGIDTFSYVLKKNLTQFIDYCASESKHQDKSPTIHNDSMISTSTSTTQGTDLFQTNFHCFADLSWSIVDISMETDSKFSTYIYMRSNQTQNCTSICHSNLTKSQYECLTCLNSLFYLSHQNDDHFLIKNGLRFKNGQYPRYLFQTISYKWLPQRTVNDFFEWQYLIDNLKKTSLATFYLKTFPRHFLWSTSEIFSTFTLMTQLYQEKYLFITIKFIVMLVFLTLFTGILGIFVTLTTLLNFVTCIATLTLMNYKLTVENMSHFVIVLIVCSQYSVLYSISYKLAPTFFFQRENRMTYSLKQLCTTLIHLTLSIMIISTPCLFSSLPYLSKSATVYIISSIISLIYSTFFLQSLLCFIGPPGQLCFFLPWRLTFTRHSNVHKTNLTETAVRGASNSGAGVGNGSGSRRHHRHLSHRMSTSSHFASSYFSQIFTGSTYFESEYGGINETSIIGPRRRESSRSHQTSHLIKQSSLLTGELIELYTPRASLAPHAHHLHAARYSRQSSVTRAVTSTTPARPLYISPSVSPYSQLSIHSQIPSRQRSPSPHIYRPSRSPSPSPHSFAPITSSLSLRPCYSAPRLHVPIHRALTASVRPNDTLLEEMPTPSAPPTKKTVMIIQRQDAISSTDDLDPSSPIRTPSLSATARRSMLKATTMPSNELIWLKRSNSS
ncbi:unnamed protein product [Adineta ricciae]|nr:unnamed protein product [Adineta ricciae]